LQGVWVSMLCRCAGGQRRTLAAQRPWHEGVPPAARVLGCRRGSAARCCWQRFQLCAAKVRQSRVACWRVAQRGAGCLLAHVSGLRGCRAGCHRRVLRGGRRHVQQLVPGVRRVCAGLPQLLLLPAEQRAAGVREPDAGAQRTVRAAHPRGARPCLALLQATGGQACGRPWWRARSAGLLCTCGPGTSRVWPAEPRCHARHLTPAVLAAQVLRRRDRLHQQGARAGLARAEPLRGRAPPPPRGAHCARARRAAAATSSS